MNKDYLKKYIQTIFPMSNDKIELVSETFELLILEKNDFLLLENKISKNTYFLESGFIRSYTFDKNGQEVTTNIFSAPIFVNDFLSFFKQQTTTENYQAVTNCKLWQMSLENVQKNFHSIPEFREFGRMMLVMNYDNLHKRMLGMIKETAETRYIKLIQQHNNIVKNIPLKMIASYLGITDTSLSRIRKEITNK